MLKEIEKMCKYVHDFAEAGPECEFCFMGNALKIGF
jgi:hypothetical protein